jgi:hypothetical protein
MSDIVDDLKSWRAQLAENAPHQTSGLPAIDIEKLDRAIEEIGRLRQALAVPHDVRRRPGRTAPPAFFSEV